ncbi:MAG: ARMT1-like domain-containing protein [Eubacteriales bacterium]|nr:ARMT1-like domain-containing protein [Eubacteriales bacterium]
MKIFLDCLPCMLKQVLEASRLVTDKPELQETIMEESIKILSDYKKFHYSPEIVSNMHNVVKQLTGEKDPYRLVKERDISAAKEAYPVLIQFLEQNQNSLYWALKIAATGNIIDSAIYQNLDLQGCIEEELSKEFKICDIQIFKEEITTARKILIIGDNAGETVFDKVLLSTFSHLDITYAVRSEPIINDATFQDAISSGLNEYAQIISTGCNAPGAVLDQCSKEFLDVFHQADIIISKGQGNFEALSECGRSLFFLLKAKCPVIANKLNVDLNDYVFINKSTVCQTS